jgi:hypothetical protein
MIAKVENAPGVKWCCPGFQNAWEQAGRRGFGIIVSQNSVGKPQFTLQFRMADVDKEASMTLPTTPFPISRVGEMGMVYCPWCGRNLAERYANFSKVLSRPELLIRPY